MTILDTRIGADTNLYTKPLVRRTKRLLKLFNEHAQPRGPWLDVGAGESYMRDQLQSQTKFPIETSECDLDSERYPFPDKHFQTITSFEVLEHLFNPLFHLKELHRVLADDGKLYLVTPNDYSLIYKAEHLLSRKYRPHFHQFSERDVRDVMQMAGFKITLLRYFFKSPSGTLARISRNGLFVVAERA